MPALRRPRGHDVRRAPFASFAALILLPALVLLAALAPASCAASASVPAPGSTQAPPSAHRALADAPGFARGADRWMADALGRLGDVPAIAVTVVVDDSVVLARAWGMADRERGVRADEDTQFYIASATKPFTALMAAILQSRGRLDLGSSLASHLPGVALDSSLHADAVTLRDLLTHTSGVANDAIAFRLAYTGEHDPRTLWRLLDRCRPADGAPLGTFRYTNVGYNLLTMITDRETGTRWQDLERDLLFAPLGMERTTAYASLGARKGWASAAPYEAFGPGGLERIALRKTDATMQSAGGLLTTARDLGPWLRFQLHDGRLGDRVLVDSAIVRGTHASLVNVAGNGERSPFGRTGYGLGWWHGAFAGRAVLWHAGAFPGFYSLVSFAPGAGVGVAVLVNEGTLGAALAEETARGCYRYWLDGADFAAPGEVDSLVALRDRFRARRAAEFAQRAARTWQLARPRSAYTGTFDSAALGRLVIRAHGDRLEVQLGRLRCTAEPFTRPETARVELVPGSGEVLTFEPAAPGAVARVRLGDDVFERVSGR